MALDARQTCGVNLLTKLAWAYWSKMAESSVFDAMAYLDVFRATYNLERPIVLPGLPQAVQDVLPASLSAAEWSPDMRNAMMVMSTVALGGAGATGVSTAMRTLPTSASGIANWFTTTLRTAVPSSVSDRFRSLLDIPYSSGNLATAVAYAARDDRAACNPIAATPSTPTPSTPNTFTPVWTSPTSVRPSSTSTAIAPGTPASSSPGSTYNGPSTTSSGGGGASSYPLFLGLTFVASIAIFTAMRRA